MSKEISKALLGPCARHGERGDWWGEQHTHCTGSHHINSNEHISCTCPCHITEVEKFVQLKDGDGFEVEPGSILNFSCCECGLVHRVAFAIEVNGNIGVVLERDEHLTKQMRNGTIKIDNS